MRDKDILVHIANKRLRGFLKGLINLPPKGVSFVNQKEEDLIFFEQKSTLYRFFSEIWSGPLGDIFGLIQQLNGDNSKADLALSYNRFIRTESIPSVIFLENPTALFHYSLGRRRSLLGRRRLRKLLNDTNLKSIVCMSEACHSSLESVLGTEIPGHVHTEQIYPLVPVNPFFNQQELKHKTEQDTLNLLFVSSEFMMKGGAEIIKAINILRDHNLKLTLITNPDTINKKSQDIIDDLRSLITVLPFNLTKDEMHKQYRDAHVLLQPTLKDSFGLTILEAMKSGVPVIGTSLYAIPEMIEDNFNGFLTTPPIRYFTENNLPNAAYWRKDELLNNRPVSEDLTTFIQQRITDYLEDRTLLYSHSVNAFNKATSVPFSCDYINEQWLGVYKKVISE